MPLNYDFAKLYDPGEGISFNEETGILSGTDDPTLVDITNGGTAIPITTLYLRSGQANPEIYVKNGVGVNDWVLIPLSSNVTTISVQEDDVVVQAATGTLNFEGSQVSLTDNGGGKVTISIASVPLDLQEGDASVVDDTNTINYEGNLLSVTDNGGGKATIAFALDLQEDDTSVNSDTAIVNFEGNLLNVTDNGDGKATIAFALDLQEDDTSVNGDTAIVNFEGNLLSVIDNGGGKATIALALDVQHEGVSVNADTNNINFEGRQFGVSTSLLEGAGNVTVSIGINVSDEGVSVDGDVISFNFIGPTSVIDDGNGLITLDTNVALGEVEDVDLTGISDNDTLKYSLSAGEWVRVASVPAAPPGSNAIVQFIDNTVGALSGTTTIPKDSTPPLISEGSEVWNINFTPVLGDSKIRITNSFTLSSSSQNMELVFGLFQDSTCVGTVVGSTVEKDSGQSIAFTFILSSPGTSLVNYSLRIGKVVGSPGSWYVNQISGLTNGFNGTLDETGYSVSELAVLGS